MLGSVYPHWPGIGLLGQDGAEDKMDLGFCDTRDLCGEIKACRAIDAQYRHQMAKVVFDV